MRGGEPQIKVEKKDSRLRVSNPKFAMKVDRNAIGQEHLVYVLLADRLLKYPKDDSKIAYIGTTMRGIARIAGSAASRADPLLNPKTKVDGIPQGIKSFDVQFVSTKNHPELKSWELLERAMLIKFSSDFGRVPYLNRHGQGFRVLREFEVFSEDRIRKILAELSQNTKPKNSRSKA